MSARQAYVLQRPARRRTPPPEGRHATGRGMGVFTQRRAKSDSPIGGMSEMAEIGRSLPSHVVLWRTNLSFCNQRGDGRWLDLLC
jgi:hypothetical protein